MSKNRKLATILFADITGYTSLMQQNEELALSGLSRFKEVLEEVTKKFDGDIIQYFGDACLLVFNSSVKGVACAIALQEEFRKKPILPVRVGMHLGDVVFSNDNVFGDGVNIASRIESLGIPGSVLVSKTIRDQIKNKEGFELQTMGFFDFKNIDESMEVFAITNNDLQVPKRSEIHGKLKPPKQKSNKALIISLISVILISAVILGWYLNKGESIEPVSNIKSIAVLPFINKEKDSSITYLCEGMAENLISALAEASDIKVISRFSSFPLKDSLPNISSIIQLLGVDAILVGNLKKANDTFLLDTELISAKDQSSLWSSRLSGKSENLPQLEKEIATAILSSLNAVSLPKSDNKTTDSEAYQHYMQGRFLSYSSDEREQELAAEHFYEAIKIDPNYAEPYAALANQLSGQARFSNTSRKQLLREARLALQSAYALDPNLPEAHQAEANMLFFSDFEWEEARESFKKALKSDPTNASILADYSFFLCAMNQYDQALELAKKAINYDPISLSSMHIIAWSQLYTEPDKAIESFDKIIELHPDWIWSYIKKAMGEILIEDYQSALNSLAQVENKKGDWGGELLECYMATLYLKCGENEKALKQQEKVLEYVDKNGLSDALNIAILYGGMGDKDQLIKWSEKCIEDQSVNVALMQLVKDLDLFKDHPMNDPRYVALLEKLRFPKKNEWVNLIP